MPRTEKHFIGVRFDANGTSGEVNMTPVIKPWRGRILAARGLNGETFWLRCDTEECATTTHVTLELDRVTAAGLQRELTKLLIEADERGDAEPEVRAE